jgi:hypothetical protein
MASGWPRSPWIEALVRIEGDQPERLERERVGDAERGRPGKHGQDEEHVGKPRAEPHRAFPRSCPSATDVTFKCPTSRDPGAS